MYGQYKLGLGLDSSCKTHVTRAYQSVVWKILEWKHVSHFSSSTGMVYTTVWTFLRAGKLYITERRGPSMNVSYFHYRSGLVFTCTHTHTHTGLQRHTSVVVGVVVGVVVVVVVAVLLLLFSFSFTFSFSFSFSFTFSFSFSLLFLFLC